MSETENMSFQEKVMREIKYGMGVTTERDIAFAALWVSRRLSDNSLVPTFCNMVDEPLTDELRSRIADVLRVLADNVEGKNDKNTAYISSSKE